MFGEIIADLLSIDYDMNTELMFYNVSSKDVCSGWYGRRYSGNDHFISRYGSDGYGKSVAICNTAWEVYFPLWIELVLIPIIFIITIINVVAERKEEYRRIHKLLDYVLAIAVFWIFIETIKIGINQYKQLNVINTLQTVDKVHVKCRGLFSY